LQLSPGAADERLQASHFCAFIASRQPSVYGFFAATLFEIDCRAYATPRFISDTIDGQATQADCWPPSHCSRRYAIDNREPSLAAIASLASRGFTAGRINRARAAYASQPV